MQSELGESLIIALCSKQLAESRTVGGRSEKEHPQWKRVMENIPSAPPMALLYATLTQFGPNVAFHCGVTVGRKHILV